MLTKTKMALAAALILGTASAALAENDRDEGGGFMIQGSMDGVNPVYHPDIFGNAGSAYASGVLAPTKRAAPRSHRPEVHSQAQSGATDAYAWANRTSGAGRLGETGAILIQDRGFSADVDNAYCGGKC